MDYKLVLIAFFAVVCAASVQSANLDAVGVLTGKDKEIPAVQPIDGDIDEEVEAEEDSSEEEEEESSEESEEDSSSGDAEVAVNACDDITGVFASTRSDAKLVVVQEDGIMSGLFRNSSESAWYEYTGVRGANADSAFGFVAIREELRGVTSVAGLCLPCDGSLDLSLINAFPKGCASVVIPMPSYRYERSGTAEQARDVVAAFRGVEEGSGEE